MKIECQFYQAMAENGINDESVLSIEPIFYCIVIDLVAGGSRTPSLNEMNIHGHSKCNADQYCLH